GEVAFFDQSVVAKIAAQIERGRNIMRSFISISGTQPSGHHSPPYLTPGQPIPLPYAQRFAYTPTGLHELSAIPLVLNHKIAMVQCFTYRVHQHFHVDNRLDEIIPCTESQGGNNITNHTGT